MKIVQRISFKLQTDDDYINYIIETFKKRKNSFTDVWLPTAYGYPILESHISLANKLGDVSKKLRENGIGVSMQLSNSLGHGQYMASCDCSALRSELLNARRMVGHDGVTAEYSFCFYDEAFIEYTDKVVRAYISEVKPDEFWIDDDLRATNHAPVNFGCFCDDCISRFNLIHGTTYDRESLVEEFLHGDILVRKKYIAFVKEGISGLARVIGKAVSQSCASTRVCLQNGPNGPYTGYGHGYICDALYESTGIAPYYRAGGGSYHDHDPNSIVDKVMNLSYQNSQLPEYVTGFCPEIENTPDTAYGKTMYGTAFEATMNLANGSTDLSFAMLGLHPEPFEFYDRGFKYFSQLFPYWERLAEVSKNTYAGGIYYAHSKKSHLRKLSSNDNMFSFNKEAVFNANAFLRNGLPLSYSEKGCNVALLHPETAAQMQKEELEALLAGNVITDASTVEIMQSMGIDMGFSFETASLFESSVLKEMFTDHVVNDVGRGEFSASFFSPGMCDYRYITRHPENAQVLGYYDVTCPMPPKTSSKEHPYGVSNVIITTQKGGKWAVMGYALWKSVIPSFERKRLFKIIDFISDCSLQAVIDSPVQAVLMPRVSRVNGKTVSVSITNCTIEEQENVKVQIRNPDSEFFELVSIDGSEMLHSQKSETGFIVIIPKIAPWSVVTVFTKPKD